MADVLKPMLFFVDCYATHCETNAFAYIPDVTPIETQQNTCFSHIPDVAPIERQ